MRTNVIICGNRDKECERDQLNKERSNDEDGTIAGC